MKRILLLALAVNSLATREFNGSIDEVSFWSVPLDDAEIGNLYDRQSRKFAGIYTSNIIDLGVSGAWSSIAWTTSLPAGKELPPASANELVTDYSEVVDATGTVGNSALGTNLVGVWHLNEASWTGAANEILDSSGNGHHGQSFNGVSTVTNGLFYAA